MHLNAENFIVFHNGFIGQFGMFYILYIYIYSFLTNQTFLN